MLGGLGPASAAARGDAEVVLAVAGRIRVLLRPSAGRADCGGVEE
jgi:hypothetical protein